MTMREFSLSVSDHILAQGIKFWTSVVKDYQIEDLDQCYQIITALAGFLTTVTSPVLEETVDTKEKGENFENDVLLKTIDEQEHDDNTKDKKKTALDVEDLIFLRSLV